MEWVSLFSGGKDSSWALYRAQQEGLDMRRLLTVHPEGDSYMYHTPATRLASLAAESIGLALEEVEPDDFDAENAIDAGEQGDAEVEPLEAALRELAEEIDIAGVTAGAVESEFQTSRIEALCERLGIELFAPLWQRDPETLAEEMLEAGFDIRIVQVAAAGLDESWLGRRLDSEAFAELRERHEQYGVHLLGEGGEFETYVVDGPHMSQRIEFDYSTVWEGNRGHIIIEDAWLE
ncbi:diphthine--ammonia ligase [Halolamina sp.]|jgi:ABC transporter with metal-binding/Fe-S-binding domain ATP-binding protein|uniref:diphthine--ammonia ligase n=1 Tax=Halolamina sp. TaxID=1940283 RepID=UPI000223B824|nr:universal metal-binding-domain/4Fe-4S-binding-domain containing ABC transporter protein [halophilic archaeon DL31]